MPSDIFLAGVLFGAVVIGIVWAAFSLGKESGEQPKAEDDHAGK